MHFFIQVLDMLTNAQLTLEQFWSLAMHFQTLSHLYCKTLGTIPWEIFQINSFLPVLYLILHNTFDQNLCENPRSIIIHIPGPVFLLLWGRRCILELHGFAIFSMQILCYNLVMWVKCLLVCKCLPSLWTSRYMRLKNKHFSRGYSTTKSYLQPKLTAIYETAQKEKEKKNYIEWDRKY